MFSSLPARPADNSGSQRFAAFVPQGLPVALLLAFFGWLFGALLWSHMLLPKADGWHSGGSTWGDLAWHLSMLSNFAERGLHAAMEDPHCEHGQFVTRLRKDVAPVPAFRCRRENRPLNIGSDVSILIKNPPTDKEVYRIGYRLQRLNWDRNGTSQRAQQAGNARRANGAKQGVRNADLQQIRNGHAANRVAVRDLFGRKPVILDQPLQVDRARLDICDRLQERYRKSLSSRGLSELNSHLLNRGTRTQDNSKSLAMRLVAGGDLDRAV